MESEELGRYEEHVINRLVNGKGHPDGERWPYYDRFFSFEEMGLREIRNFLYGESNPKPVKGIRLSSIEPILNDRLMGMDIHHGLLKECLNAYPIQEYPEIKGWFPQWFSDEFKKALRSLVRFCLYSAMDKDLGVTLEKTSERQIEFAEEQIERSEKDKKTFYYRGQSDSSWSIVPSIARSLPIKNARGDLYYGVFLDIKGLYHLYCQNKYSDSLIEKYNKYYVEEQVLKPDDIGYSFLAWMQHTVQYSPLVDFTSDYCVAASFALSAKNPNAFLNGDSAIYVYELADKSKHVDNIGRIDDIISKMHICVTNKKIVPGSSKEAFKPGTGRTRTISYKTYGAIIKKLVPSYIIIDIQSNDRMRRQRGAFILLYDYEIIEGQTFDKLENLTKVTKHIIKAGQKRDLLEWLHENHPEADMPFLMNPYLDFED